MDEIVLAAAERAEITVKGTMAPAGEVRAAASLVGTQKVWIEALAGLSI
jgi:hypothetical protein